MDEYLAIMVVYHAEGLCRSVEVEAQEIEGIEWCLPPDLLSKKRALVFKRHV